MGEAVKALQHPDELARFVELVRSEGVRSYLEIGSKFGGTFSAVTRTMPPGSRAVAVDLPSGTKHWAASRVALEACVSQLKKTGYDTHLIWGDSTDRDVIRQVAWLGPFDLILIDANHTMPYVQSDWDYYGLMGRMVAFHDIAWRRAPDWQGSYRIDVPAFWESIKTGYRHQEIKLDRTGEDNGIGILWRQEHAWQSQDQNEQEQDAGPHDAGSSA
jgi:predicted O-methyltransferase YrrM